MEVRCSYQQEGKNACAVASETVAQLKSTKLILSASINPQCCSWQYILFFVQIARINGSLKRRMHWSNQFRLCTPRAPSRHVALFAIIVIPNCAWILSSREGLLVEILDKMHDAHICANPWPCLEPQRLVTFLHNLNHHESIAFQHTIRQEESMMDALLKCRRKRLPSLSE